MKIKILAFGIAKDILGKQTLTISFETIATVKTVKAFLSSKYPTLPDFMIAVNEKYAKDNQKIKPQDEIAIIPPTNGG